MKRVLALTLACGVASASSEVLWDQQPVAQQTGVNNQVYVEFGGFSGYLANDATFTSNVNVEAVTVYFFTPDGTDWANQGSGGTGTLNIFDVVGFEPDDANDDPTAGTPVSITFADHGDGIVSATASGLDIDLVAGSYWFNLTPNIEFNVYGGSFAAYAAGSSGFGSSVFDPDLPPAFGWTQPFSPVSDEMALTIIGTPAPGSAALLALGGLVASRRRR